MLEMLESSTPYSAAAMIITAAMAALPSKFTGSDRDFLGAFCASATCFSKTAPVPLLGCMHIPIPSRLNSLPRQCLVIQFYFGAFQGSLGPLLHREG